MKSTHVEHHVASTTLPPIKAMKKSARSCFMAEFKQQESSGRASEAFYQTEDRYMDKPTSLQRQMRP